MIVPKVVDINGMDRLVNPKCCVLLAMCIHSTTAQPVCVFERFKSTIHT